MLLGLDVCTNDLRMQGISKRMNEWPGLAKECFTGSAFLQKSPCFFCLVSPTYVASQKLQKP